MEKENIALVVEHLNSKTKCSTNNLDCHKTLYECPCGRFGTLIFKCCNSECENTENVSIDEALNKSMANCKDCKTDLVLFCNNCDVQVECESCGGLLYLDFAEDPAMNPRDMSYKCDCGNLEDTYKGYSSYPPMRL